MVLNGKCWEAACRLARTSPAVYVGLGGLVTTFLVIGAVVLAKLAPLCRRATARQRLVDEDADDGIEEDETVRGWSN